MACKFFRMEADMMTIQKDVEIIKNALAGGLPETMTATQVAEFFKISRVTIWKWERKGFLKPHRVFKRKLYKRVEVMDLFNKSAIR